jgi:hypothetical protein
MSRRDRTLDSDRDGAGGAQDHTPGATFFPNSKSWFTPVRRSGREVILKADAD